MEFYWSKQNKIIKTKSNIFALFGQNNSGKSSFLQHIQSLAKSNKLIIEGKEHSNYKDVIFINDEFNLKLELELSKKSNLWKNIGESLRDFLEIREINVVQNFLKTTNFDEILKAIDQNINFNHQNLKIKSYFSYETDLDFLQSIIKLKVFANDENFIESMLSKSEKFEIFYNLLISIESKNKIYLFDTPDTGLTYYGLKNLSALIRKLSQNNLVFLTYRNPKLISFLEMEDEDIFYLQNQEIKILKLPSKIIIISYLILRENKLFNKINSLDEFNEKFDRYSNLIEDHEIKKIMIIFYNKFLITFFDNINFETNIFYNEKIFVNEDELLIFDLILLVNEIKKQNHEEKILTIWKQDLIKNFFNSLFLD